MAKRRFVDRAPLVLSIAALTVAVLGVTPLGTAALEAVPFALNSAKVNGIKASRKPKAGHLVPLGANRKFPQSVVPAGPRGPQGPQGPDGPAGPAGPPATSLFAVVNADGSVYKRSSSVVSVQRTEVGTYQIAFDRPVDDCAAVATVGGHRLTETTWTGVQEAFAAAATYGSLVVVKTLRDNGFNPPIRGDFIFHVAVFC